MPNRILKESICTSESIDRLSTDAEIFFYRLIVQCDDFGRFDARPSVLRARCFPLRLESVTDALINQWLHELVDTGTVQVYYVDGKPFLQFVAWDDHQQVRAKRSKYPAPLAIDSNGNQSQSFDSKCPRNPIQSNSESESESKTNPTAGAWGAFFSARGGSINSLDNEQVKDLENLYGSEAVEQAVWYCNTNKKQAFLSLNYIIKILQSWQAEGTLGMHPPANGNGNGNGTKQEQQYRYEEMPDGNFRKVPVTA